MNIRVKRTRVTNHMGSALVRLATLTAHPSCHFLYPIAYMGMIYILSSIPGAPVASENSTAMFLSWLPPDIQNLLHVPLYAGLAFLWCKALRVSRTPVRLISITALLLTAGYGLLDEWHQSLIPGRYCSATDVLADISGAIIGTWLFFRGSERVSNDLR